MKTLQLVIVTAILSHSTISLADSQDTYLGCLKHSFNGNHNFTASEVRSLCEETSGTQDASYKWGDGEKLTPSNEFTVCYDKEKQKLLPIGKERAGEVAKIICRYEAR